MSSYSSKPEQLKGKVLKAASGTFLFRGINVGSNLLITILLANLLGSRGYGIYSYAMTILKFLVVAAILGLPALIVREMSINRTRGNWSLIKGLRRWAIRMIFTSSSALLILAYLILWKLRGHIEREVFISISVALLILPIHCFLRVQEAIVRGLFHVIRAQIPMQIIRPLLFFLLLSIYFMINKTATPYVAMILHLLAFLTATIYGISLLKQTSASKDISPTFEKQRWFRSIWPFYLIEIGDTLYERVDILILGTLRDPHEVGIYHIAYRLAFIIVLAINAVNVVYAPTIASLYSEGKKDALQHLITHTTRLLLLFLLPLGFIYIVFGLPLISFLFGEEFSRATTPLTILTISQLIVAAMGPVRDILTMTGHEKVVTKGLALSVFLITSLNLLLIPAYGYLGAAIASSVNMITIELLFLLKVVRLVGLRPTIIG